MHSWTCPHHTVEQVIQAVTYGVCTRSDVFHRSLLSVHDAPLSAAEMAPSFSCDLHVNDSLIEVSSA